MLSACHKDPGPEEPLLPALTPGRYQTTASVLATSPIEVYTGTGRVTDAAIISRLVARQNRFGGSIPYFSATDLPVSSWGTLTLVLHSHGQAVLLSAPTAGTGPTDSTRCEITAQTPTTFTLTQLDSVGLYSPAGSTTDRCMALAEEFNNARPTKRCRRVSPASGYSAYCRFRPVNQVVTRAGRFYWPILSWAIQSGPPPYYNQCGRLSRTAGNLFNRTILNQLTVLDTIVVQEREIELVRQ